MLLLLPLLPLPMSKLPIQRSEEVEEQNDPLLSEEEGVILSVAVQQHSHSHPQRHFHSVAGRQAGEKRMQGAYRDKDKGEELATLCARRGNDDSSPTRRETHSSCCDCPNPDLPTGCSLTLSMCVSLIALAFVPFLEQCAAASAARPSLRSRMREDASACCS